MTDIISDDDMHQSLMNSAYERWKVSDKMSKEEFHDTLTPVERFAVHTGNFNYQVCNGGFMQWWDNRYGTPDTVEFLLRACERMNTETSKKVSVLLQKYKRVMSNYEPNASARDYPDEDQWEEISAGLDGLDTAFYDINDQFLVDCEAHLKAGGI